LQQATGIHRDFAKVKKQKQEAGLQKRIEKLELRIQEPEPTNIHQYHNI